MTNLLSHPSRPTNPALAHALAILQIAERQGVGIDLMYREMIWLGHQPPEIDAVGANIRCRIEGGPPDPGSIATFSQLPDELVNDVEIAIAIHALRTRKTISARDLGPLIQRSEPVAASALQRAGDHGLIERVSRTSTRWHASGRLHGLTAAGTTRQTRRTTEELEFDVVRHAATATKPFARSDIDRTLGIGERRARQVIEELVARQWLSPVGATTGRSVRYERGPRWRQAARALRENPGPPRTPSP